MRPVDVQKKTRYGRHRWFFILKSENFVIKVWNINPCHSTGLLADRKTKIFEKRNLTTGVRKHHFWGKTIKKFRLSNYFSDSLQKFQLYYCSLRQKKFDTSHMKPFLTGDKATWLKLNTSGNSIFAREGIFQELKTRIKSRPQDTSVRSLRLLGRVNNFLKLQFLML